MNNSVSRLQRDLTKQGLSIIRCDNLNDIESISRQLINKFKKNKSFKSKLKKINIKEINKLRKLVNKFEDTMVNSIKQIYLNKFPENILKAFSSVLFPMLGSKIFISKSAQFLPHIGYSDLTATWPHSELMAGHSPFTYTIWMPLHNIIDNSGIFAINDKLSVKLCDIEIKKQIKNRRKFLSGHSFFPKLNFGEAIIFNTFVYHGAIKHKNDRARLALVIRVQNSNRPLFEKYNDFFTTLNL